jgi:hypothetical protein
MEPGDQGTGGGQPATSWQPAQTEPSRRGRVGCVLFAFAIALALVLIYGFLFRQLGQMLAVPTQRIGAEVSEGSGGRIFNTMNVPAPPGRQPTFLFYVAADVTTAEAAGLACTVVRPVLSREGFPSASFVLLQQTGGIPGTGPVMASDSTPCP